MNHAKDVSSTNNTEYLFSIRKTWRTKNLLELIHTDVCGPMMRLEHTTKIVGIIEKNLPTEINLSVNLNKQGFCIERFLKL